MRVLYANHTGLMSGAERSLIDLLERLPSHVEPAVATPAGPLAEAVKARGVPIADMPQVAGGLKVGPRHTSRALGGLGATAVRLARHARAWRADVIHANSVRAGLSAGVAKLVGGPPVVAHVRDCLPESRVATIVRTTILGRCDAVVAVSAHTARRFSLSGEGEGIEVVFDPVRLEPFEHGSSGAGARTRESLGIPSDADLLSVIAQITPWKGQDDAIRMLAGLRAADRHAHLLVVGEPKFVDPSTRMDNSGFADSLPVLARELGVSDSVHFLGERSDVPALLDATDIAVVPSWEEPFGRSVAEGMAAGNVVIATSVGGPREFIEDGVSGLLEPPLMPERWVIAAAQILDDGERRAAMSRAAVERANELFAGAGPVEGLVRIYERVCGPRVSRRASRRP